MFWLAHQMQRLTAWVFGRRLRAIQGGRKYRPSEIEAIRQRNRMRL